MAYNASDYYERAPVDDPEARKREEAKKAKEERLSALVSQALTQEARERLNRVALVHKDLSKVVSERIASAVQCGMLSSKIDDKQLIAMLEKAKRMTTTQTRITVQRKGEGDCILGAHDKRSEGSDSEEEFDSSESDGEDSGA